MPSRESTAEGAKCLVAYAEFPEWRGVLGAVADKYPAPPDTITAQRIAEFAIALMALAVGLPIMLLVAALIRLDSRGPVLFRQVRVGQGGRLFTFIKFRTFWHDAPRRFPHLYQYEFTPGEVEQMGFKQPDDPRVTPVGRWLRSTSLDELPNFWHVLTGEMRLVGPRPEIPQMLPYYLDGQLVKFSVRPGLTGLAQISGRGHLRFREAARLDAEYARSRTLGGDLRILWRTIALVVRRHGAF